MSAREHEAYSNEMYLIFNAIAEKIGIDATANLIDDLTSKDQEKDLMAFFLLSRRAEEVYKANPALKNHDYWFRCTLNASVPHTKQDECIPFVHSIRDRLQQKLN